MTQQSSASVATGAEQFEGKLTYASEDEPEGKYKGDVDTGGKQKPKGKGTAGQDAGNRRNLEPDEEEA